MMYEIYDNIAGKAVLQTEEEKVFYGFFKNQLERHYMTWEKLVEDVAMNQNDSRRLSPEDWNGCVNPSYAKRRWLSYVNGNVIDIRSHKADVCSANGWWYRKTLYHQHNRHYGPGVSETRLPYRSMPKYKHYVAEREELKELARNGISVPAPVDTTWYPYLRVDSGWYYARDWKRQSKSRKQWARHAERPVSRKDIAMASDAKAIDMSDIEAEEES